MEDTEGFRSSFYSIAVSSALSRRVLVRLGLQIQIYSGLTLQDNPKSLQIYVNCFFYSVYNFF